MAIKFKAAVKAPKSKSKITAKSVAIGGKNISQKDAMGAAMSKAYNNTKTFGFIPKAK